MSYPNQQQMPQGGYAATSKPKKEKINVWEGVGIVRARSANENDPIRLFDFANGGAGLHISLKCSEFTGTADQNGNPKMKIVSVPVDIYTNKNVTKEILGAVVPGMKVHVVGKLDLQSYDSKKNPGTKVTSLVVKAFVFEILEGPQYVQSPYMGQQMPPQAPAYNAPAYPQGYAPQQQMPPQAPVYGAPAYPQGYAPAPPQAPGYQAPPQPQGYQGQQMPPQAPAYGAPAQPQQPAQVVQPQRPPYYQNGQGTPVTAPRVDDLPPDDMPA